MYDYFPSPPRNATPCQIKHDVNPAFIPPATFSPIALALAADTVLRGVCDECVTRQE